MDVDHRVRSWICGSPSCADRLTAAIRHGLATAVDMAVITPLRATEALARVIAEAHTPATVVVATIVRRAGVAGTPTVAAEAATIAVADIPAEVVVDTRAEVVVDTPAVVDIVAIANGKETS